MELMKALRNEVVGNELDGQEAFEYKSGPVSKVHGMIMEMIGYIISSM